MDLNKDKIVYFSQHSPTYTITVLGRLITAEQGVLRLSQEEADALEVLIASGRPDLRQNLVRFDQDKAEALAKAHIARHKPAPAAVRDASTSDDRPITAVRHAGLAQDGEIIKKTGGIMGQLGREPTEASAGSLASDKVRLSPAPETVENQGGGDVVK